MINVLQIAMSALMSILVQPVKMDIILEEKTLNVTTHVLPQLTLMGQSAKLVLHTAKLARVEPCVLLANQATLFALTRVPVNAAWIKPKFKTPLNLHREMLH